MHSFLKEISIVHQYTWPIFKDFRKGLGEYNRTNQNSLSPFSQDAKIFRRVLDTFWSKKHQKLTDKKQLFLDAHKKFYSGREKKGLSKFFFV